MHIRLAVPDDVAAMVLLAADSRAAHEEYQPVFWRSRAGAADMQDAWFRFLLTSEVDLVLVATSIVDGLDAGQATLLGYLIAKVVDAPPVYDPGGSTCIIDDFVAPPGPVFDGLLAAARRWAADEGAVQVVVVTAALDVAKRRALAGTDLTVASEWWVGPTVAEDVPPEALAT